MQSKKPVTDVQKLLSTWIFENGTLTIQHHGQTVSLGRYATREYAAKAAAVYFDKHGGRVSGASSATLRP